MKGVFVTGTDTGVGKTVVATALIAAFVRRGLRVTPMKPCETGGGGDAERLIAASGRDLALDEVARHRFGMPASPEVAARAAGARVDVDQIACAVAIASLDLFEKEHVLTALPKKIARLSERLSQFIAPL